MTGSLGRLLDGNKTLTQAPTSEVCIPEPFVLHVVQHSERQQCSLVVLQDATSSILLDTEIKCIIQYNKVMNKLI